MKHIKNFETLNDALGQKVENPSVSKIGDDIYYSKQEGVITSISNNTLNIVDEIEYWKSQPLTITNIGDTEGTVSIIGRNPYGSKHKTLSTGYIYLYKNGSKVSTSNSSLTSYHSSNNYNVVTATILPGESIQIKASTNLTICNQNYYDTSGGPYLNFNLENSKFKASGNMQSINKYSFSDVTSQQDGLFYKLFYNCINLTNIENLYCPIVGNYCYRETFRNTGVDTLPIFDDTYAYDYSLQWAFKNCQNLIDLSHQYLIDYITEAFEDCYGMFENCYNLEKAPVLYKLGQQMFKGCRNLSYVKIDRYIWFGGATESHYDWLYGVASEGVMWLTSDSSSSYCGSSTVPCGWEVKTIN